MTQMATLFPLVLQAETGNPCQALRGLLHQAVRAGASVVDVHLSPASIVLGHNGHVPPTSFEAFQVVGVPVFLGMAQHDLLSLLNPQWCSALTLSTAQWSVRITPGVDGATLEDLPVDPEIQGVWFALEGDFLDTVTVDWLTRALGFNSVQLQINGVRQPEASRGAVVLETPFLDLHLFEIHRAGGGLGDLRSLGQHQHALHLQGETCHLFEDLVRQAFGMFGDLLQPEFMHFPARLQGVVKAAGRELLLCGEATGLLPHQVNETALLQLLKETLVGLPALLTSKLQSVLQHLQGGLDQEDFKRLCKDTHLPDEWVELALVQHGWRPCPVLTADGLRPRVQVQWWQDAMIGSNPPEVLTHNLLKLLGDDRPWCAMANLGEMDTLIKEDLPLMLSEGRILVRDAQKLRKLLQSEDARMHLLMNISGLTLNPTDSFFAEDANLFQASLLLETVLPALN